MDGDSRESAASPCIVGPQEAFEIQIQSFEELDQLIGRGKFNEILIFQGDVFWGMLMPAGYEIAVDKIEKSFPYLKRKRLVVNKDFFSVMLTNSDLRYFGVKTFPGTGYKLKNRLDKIEAELKSRPVIVGGWRFEIRPDGQVFATSKGSTLEYILYDINILSIVSTVNVLQDERPKIVRCDELISAKKSN